MANYAKPAIVNCRGLLKHYPPVITNMKLTTCILQELKLLHYLAKSSFHILGFVFSRKYNQRLLQFSTSGTFRISSVVTYPVASFLCTHLNLGFNPAVSPVTRLNPHDLFRAICGSNADRNTTHSATVEIVIKCHALGAC